MKKIKYSLISARIFVSLISSSSTLIYIMLNGVFHYRVILQSFAIFFVTCAGFIYNDIYDYQKDKLAHKTRPICNDQLSKKEAQISAAIFLLIALIIPLLFTNIKGFLVVLGTGIGVILYSPFSKRFSLIKGLYTSFLCCTPILFASVLSNHFIPLESYSTIICFITGREILLDIYDSKGDIKAGRKTMPAFIGIKRSLFLSWAFMFATIPLLLFFSKNNIYVLITSLFAFPALIYCSLLPLTQEKKVVTITRVVIFVSSVTLAFM